MPVRPLRPDDELYPPDDSVDLQRRTVRGGATTMALQVLKFVLRLASNVLLARLLAPRDFGLVAMAATVTQLATLVRDLGLSLATVQRPSITHRQVSTLFWLNVATSAIVAVIVLGVGPLLAAFYSEPEVALIVAALAASFVFSGLTAQHTALLRRQLRFSAVGWIETASMAIGVIGAVILALAGANYWALVAMTLLTTASGMVITWLASGWMPGRPGRLRDVREMIFFGANFTGSNVLTAISRQADNLLIGWRWGSEALGLYSRAYSLLLLPLKQVNTPMTGVALPVLSRLQDNPDEYRRYYRRALNLVNHITLPFIVVVGALAEPVIVVVLGEQWRSAGPIFSVLAIAALNQPTLYTLSWVTTSMGRSDKHLRFSAVTAPIVVIAFVIGLPYGPIGVATAYAVATNAILVPGMAYAYRGTPLGLRDLRQAVWRPATASLLIGTVVVSVRVLAGAILPNVQLVLLSIACAALAAMAMLGIWPGWRQELASIARLRRDLRS